MPVANTAVVPLTTAGWTLLADGDAGVSDVLVQLGTAGKAILALALSLPGAGTLSGIALTSADVPFSAALLTGQKLYGRADGAAVSVTVMAGGA